MELVGKIKSLIFFSEKKCLFCLEENIYRDYICYSCLKKLEYVDGLIEMEGNRKCYYPYLYNGFLREEFKKFKFQKKSHMARAFSRLLIRYMEEKPLGDFDYILFVPVTNRTILNRGYNQVYLISKYIGEDLGIGVLDFFEKTRDTKEQNKISFEERKSNLKGSLRIRDEYLNSDILRDKKVLVVDDLITSGQTLGEIYLLLEGLNTRDISFLVLSSGRKVNKEKDL